MPLEGSTGSACSLLKAQEASVTAAASSARVSTAGAVVARDHDRAAGACSRRNQHCPHDFIAHAEALAEVQYALSFYDWFAEEAKRIVEEAQRTARELLQGAVRQA